MFRGIGNAGFVICSCIESLLNTALNNMDKQRGEEKELLYLFTSKTVAPLVYCLESIFIPQDDQVELAAKLQALREHVIWQELLIARPAIWRDVDESAARLIFC